MRRIGYYNSIIIQSPNPRPSYRNLRAELWMPSDVDHKVRSAHENSLDYFVDDREQEWSRIGEVEPKRFGGLEIDH